MTALGTLAGCARPGATGSTRPAPEVAIGAGIPAAAFDVEVEAGIRVAEIDVFSPGVYPRGEQTLVGIGLTVRCTGSAAVELDPALLSVSVYTVDGAIGVSPLTALQPDGTGNRRVMAGMAREFQAVFGVPRGLLPEDVSSFRLRWAVLGPNGKRTVQFTYFTPDPTRPPPGGLGYAFVPAKTFYDPSLYDATATRAIVRQHQPVRQVVVVPNRARD